MSLKYSLAKAHFRIVFMQKIMAKPYDELMKRFGTDLRSGLFGANVPLRPP